jgi:hypothetical protein
MTDTAPATDAPPAEVDDAVGVRGRLLAVRQERVPREIGELEWWH